MRKKHFRINDWSLHFESFPTKRRLWNAFWKCHQTQRKFYWILKTLFLHRKQVCLFVYFRLPSSAGRISKSWFNLSKRHTVKWFICIPVHICSSSTNESQDFFLSARLRTLTSPLNAWENIFRFQLNGGLPVFSPLCYNYAN